MEDIEFEWDDEKAESNLNKHGVSFEEGATIFNDPRGLDSIARVPLMFRPGSDSAEHGFRSELLNRNTSGT
jgi:hypothetical protein